MHARSSSIPPADAAPTRSQLRRAHDDRLLAGVCAGLARTLGVAPLVMRVIALVVGLALPPLAVIGYAALAIAMPADDGRMLLGSHPGDRRDNLVGWGLIGASAIGVMAGLEASWLHGSGGLFILAGGLLALVVHHQRSGERGALTAAAATAPIAAGGVPARRPVDLPYPGRPAGPASSRATTPGAPRPAPVVVPAPPREPSIAVYGVAGVVGASALALVASALGVVDITGRGVAVALGTGALCLTAGAIVFARRRGAFTLVALAVVLAIGALGAATVGDYVEDGVGDRTHHIATSGDLTAEHTLGIGALTLDVSQNVLPPGTTTVRARVGIGELNIEVPPGVRVVAAGSTSLDGLRFVNDTAGVAPSRTLRVIADVEHGSAAVGIARP